MVLMFDTKSSVNGNKLTILAYHNYYKLIIQEKRMLKCSFVLYFDGISQSG